MHGLNFVWFQGNLRIKSNLIEFPGNWNRNGTNRKDIRTKPKYGWLGSVHSVREPRQRVRVGFWSSPEPNQ